MSTRQSGAAAFAAHCEWTGASSRDRDAWLAARRQGVGGSDAAAIVGVDDFTSALELYAEKIGAPLVDARSEPAEWGQAFEPLIIREYARRSGRRTVRGGRLMRSLRASHHLVTLDGVQWTRPPAGARGPGVVEVKTTGYGQRYEEDLPVEVQVQIQWELFVTGAEWATCVWLPFPERRMQWLDVLPHAEFQAALAEKVDDFWRRVQRREPPAPDGSESARRALQALYPEQSEEVIRIMGGGSLADEYERNAAAIKLLEHRQALIKNTLAATVRSARYAVLEDGRYWGASYYAPRERKCPHCTGVLEQRGSYRTLTLRAARKKPFPALAQAPAVALALPEDALARALAESSADNDTDRSPASGPV